MFRWRQALNRLRSAEDRFVTLGYLAQAHCENGDYNNMLDYSMIQIELANNQNDHYMKSEAYLNLAKVYERLADYSKAIGYGKSSLQHQSMDPRTPGYALLVIAQSYMSFSQFQPSLDAFEQAMQVAHQTGDRLLELQICIGLGCLFTFVKDLGKALMFLRNGLSILHAIPMEDVQAKYKSLILYHLSVLLRKSGAIVDAKDACEESLRISIDGQNRPTQARALAALADINQELGETEKSWARYDAAYEMMRKINDKMGQVLILGSMAKSASEGRRHDLGQCECQAIQLNKKCLDVAKSIGCKYSMLKCHLRLSELYAQLNDEDSEDIAKKAVTSLTQEMELFCNFCGQRYGIRNESLQALRCSHIFHERCLHNHLSQRGNKTCPKCQCRAVLMDNISTQTPQEESLPGPSDFVHLGNFISAPSRLKPCCSKDDFGLPMALKGDQGNALVVSRALTVTDV